MKAQLLLAALAALAWARLAAWLLVVYEHEQTPTRALDHATWAVDFTPCRERVDDALAPLDSLRLVWCAMGPLDAPRIVALDAVRCALLTARDALDAPYALDAAAMRRNAGVHETLALTLRAWCAYACVHSDMPGAMQDFGELVAAYARGLAPLVTLAAIDAAPRAAEAPASEGRAAT